MNDTKLWYFEWCGGGYNTVHAKNKREAYRAATAMGLPGGGMIVTLYPDYDSFTTDKTRGEYLERTYRD
jgi:hypothetical protein